MNLASYYWCWDHSSCFRYFDPWKGNSSPRCSISILFLNRQYRFLGCQSLIYSHRMRELLVQSCCYCWLFNSLQFQFFNLLFINWQNLVGQSEIKHEINYYPDFFITLLILKKLQEAQNNSPRNEVAVTLHLLWLWRLKGEWVIIFHSQQ